MRYKPQRLLLTCIIIFVALNCQVWPVIAQKIKFKHLSIEDGLSQNSVKCIFQDQQGFIWFGTWDGLNRYDGYSFEVFRNDPQDSTSISNNFAWSIYEDRSGRLWVGTFGGGLNLFDAKTKTFKHYNNDPNNSSSLSSNDVFSIHEDYSGQLWVGTGGGLDLFDPKTKTFEHYKHDPASPSSLSNDGVNYIYEDHSDRLWVGTNGDGLNLFDPKTKTFEHYRDPKKPLNHVYTIYQDNSGRLWVGTYTGLMHFDTQKKTFEHYENDPKNPLSLSNNDIRFIYEANSGGLWVGTNVGLNLFDPINKTFSVFTNSPRDPSSLSNNSVLSVYEDPAGQLLVGVYGGGINLLDLKEKQFETFSRDPNQPSSLSNNIVRSIYEDQSRGLWVGTDGGGLNLFDAKTKTFEHYYNNPKNSASLSNNNIQSICGDHSGQLWVGTNNGLNLFDSKTKTFEHYNNDSKNSGSLSSNHVRSIYEDRSGHLWVGTDQGLNLFEVKTRTFVRYNNDPENSSSLSSNFINSIYEDHSGRLWIATAGGLNLFDTERKSFERYIHNPDNTSSLSNDYVIFIYEDSNNRLWVGTIGGLNFFDSHTKKFSTLGAKQGLPDDLVCGMLEDELGKLWLSTIKGLSRFTPSVDFAPEQGHVGVFRNYDLTDGLQNNEFNEGVCFKGKDGRMYFGGVNGFNAFDPHSIRDNPHVPPIVLTGFELFNKSVAPCKAYDGFVLPISITLANELILSYRESVFTLVFSALSYVQAEKNKYAYKLEGFDRDWNYTDAKRRFATYTNLDPGTYTFHIKGSNHDGIWNEKGRTLLIIITPPWWKTLWFQILSVLGLFGAAILVSVIRTNSIRKMNRVLAETVDQKTKELQTTNQALVEQDEEIKSQNTVLKEQREELATQNEELIQSREEISAQRDLVAQQNETLSRQREELASQNKELSNLNIEKNNLIGIVAHDLKSPLNQIKGLISVIKMSPASGNEETSEYVQLIENSANRLTGMIGKILDVEAIESKQLNLTLEQVNFSELAQCIVDRFIVEAQKKQIRLHSSIREQVSVNVDRSYTDEVIENLLSNAIKFSPEAKNVYINITAYDGKAICEIRDEGPGLNDEDKKKLFGKYQKLSAKPTGNETSTGLGLSIVKRFVEAMDGKIWCESQEGKGASFFVQFNLVS